MEVVFLVLRCPTHGAQVGACSLLAGCRVAVPAWTVLVATYAFPALLIAVAVLGFGNRVQYLTDLPRYTDEINEILPAFDIVRGTRFPLMSGPKHIGAFWDYLLAGGMLLFGRSPDLPRMMILAAGLATLAVTFGYARSLGGRWAGLLAMGLLAVSAPHVLLSSRVAWSVCLTPLLGLGAAWALDHAVRHQKPWFLLVTGLLAGLALQAHPSFAAVIPGLAVYLLWRGWRFLKGPQIYLAGLLFVAAFSNVLIYNIQSGIGGVRSVNAQYPDKELGSLAYLDTMFAPWRGLLLTLSSAIDPTREASALTPFVLFVGALTATALAYLTWKRTALPALVTVLAMLLLPFVHDDFAPILKSRYIMPLVPLAFVAIAVLLVQGIGQFRGWPRVVGAATGLVLMAGMQTQLMHFESVALAADCSNDPQREMIGHLEAQMYPNEWILLDQGSLPSAERMGYLTLLELSRRKIGEGSFGRGKIWDELSDRDSFLTLVSDGKATQLFEKQRLPLLPQTVAAVHPALRQPGSDGALPPQGIGLYRVTRDGAQLLAHDSEPGCGALLLN
ncbi:MAG: glycosyltransferase family 39 protein [Chloroflexi bacterium]|nr:glycosyltransferase family 39 protein [Chloroflexota bacterium]